ncbi:MULTISPECIES: hypothetical protein [unclassified Marinovum]
MEKDMLAPSNTRRPLMSGATGFGGGEPLIGAMSRAQARAVSSKTPLIARA